MWNDYSSALSIYNSDRSTYSILTYSNLSLGNSSTNYKGLLRTANVTANRTYTLPDKDGTVALTSDIPDTSSFLTSETDPVFSASAAAGITSTDISNWNAKISDTGKWNGVTLNKSENTATSDLFVPCTISTSNDSAYFIAALKNATTAYSLVRRNDKGEIVAATPAADSNGLVAATTAWVNNAIANFITLADLPIYDGTVV